MSRARTSASIDSLHAESQHLLAKFLQLDVETARTFLATAHLEAGLGDTERAQGLIARSKKAVASVATFLHKLDNPTEADRLWRELARLRLAIQDLEESCELLRAS